MKKISETDLTGLAKDKVGKREFNRKAYRYAGIGTIAFIVSLVVVFVKGFELTSRQMLFWFVVGMAGGIGDYIYHRSAQLKKPRCESCASLYKIFLNADRPDDIEYIYVCEKCSKYYKILHATKPLD